MGVFIFPAPFHGGAGGQGKGLYFPPDSAEKGGSRPGTAVGLHGESPHAVDAVNGRVLGGHFDVLCRLREGDVPPGEGAPDLGLAQILQAAPLFRRKTGHHGDELFPFPEEPDSQSRIGRLEGVRHVLSGQTEFLDGVPQDGADDLDPFAPVVPYVDAVGVFFQNGHGFVPEVPEGVGILAQKADLDLRAAARTLAEGADSRVEMGQFGPDKFCEPAFQPFSSLRVLCLHDEMAVVRRGVPGGVGEDEAQGSFPRVDSHGFRFGLTGKEGLHSPAVGEGGFHAGSPGPPEIHGEHGARGVGEEGFVHHAEGSHGEDQQGEHRGDDGLPPGEADPEEIPVRPVDGRAVRIGGDCGFRCPEDGSSREGGDRYREEPAEHKGNAHHLEEAPAVFTCAVGGEPYGGEGDYGDDGRPEKGHLGLPHHLPGGSGGVLPLLDSHENAVGHHDGVVHEHPEGDDESPERDAVEVDGREFHGDEGGEDGEKEHGADEQAAPEAHEDEKDADNDGEGLEKVRDEVIDGLFDCVRLVVDQVHLHPHGGPGEEFPEPPVHRFADGDHVAPVHIGDAYAEGGFAVEPHGPCRRFHVAPGYRGDVAEPEGLPGACPEQKVFQDVQGRKVSRGGYAKQLRPHGCRARSRDDVLGGKKVRYFVQGDSQGSHAGAVHLQVDDLLLDAGDFHFCHPRNEKELTAQEVSVILQLPEGIAVPGEGEIYAEDIAVVVVHHRRARSRGEAGLDIRYFSAKFVPYLGKILRRVGVLDVHVNDGHSFFRE